MSETNRFYCPDHQYTPPDNCGLAFCPMCEFPEEPMKHCPQCDGPLEEVPRHSRWLNDYQYQSQKAGDWFCSFCPGNGRGQTNLCYWTDKEVEDYARARCAAISRT